MGLVAVVLAAGEGKRMKSSLPKVLHPLCGKPMIDYVLDSVKKLKPDKTIVVVGHGGDKVISHLASRKNLEVVIQEKQLGTGDAIGKTEAALKNFNGDIIVVCGDTPLLKPSTLQRLIREHRRNRSAATLLTAKLSNPAGYGRIIRNKNNDIKKIVEEKDASKEEKEVSEVNSGTYCFKKNKLFLALKKITPENKQKEYYLTDTIKVLVDEGEKVSATLASDSSEILGANSRKELAFLEEIIRRKINEDWMAKGVSIVDPASTFVGDEVKIGADTRILPFTFLEGKTRVGKNCTIGPFTCIYESKIGDEVTVMNSVVKESVVGDKVTVGPFAYLRPGTCLKKGAKAGTFVEIKKSSVGEGSKVPHLSYVGDTEIGKNVNVGAGTITCNYDGFRKYKTIIEDNAFIGSDAQLVAPVKIGKGSVTGAGSVITDDVPAESLALERCEQKIIKGWAKKRRLRKKNKRG